MAKLGVFLLLLALSVLAAGLFGALHNQISYSVGPDYFLRYKFQQFAVPMDLSPRIGAAMVGWQASWWMGLFVGLPPFLLGAILFKEAVPFRAAGIRAIAAVLLSTAIAASGGLLFASLAINAEIAAELPLPVVASDPLGFVRAGIMHDASYLGGFAGVFLAIWIVFRASRKSKEASVTPN